MLCWRGRKTLHYPIQGFVCAKIVVVDMKHWLDTRRRIWTAFFAYSKTRKLKNISWIHDASCPHCTAVVWSYTKTLNICVFYFTIFTT